MKPHYLILFFLIATVCDCMGQADSIFTSGMIKFEKKVDMYGQMRKKIKNDKSPNSVRNYADFRNNRPQFVTSYSNLAFKGNATLYQAADPKENMVLSLLQAQSNTVFNDCASKTSIIQRHFLESVFLIKDSTRHINWKLTDETRNIAGYPCRRANALVMDSMYVVAFFTVQIPLSSGPETFAGLPGMILGLALPHENTTWFATTVEVKSPDKISIVPPNKGKVVNNSEYKDTVTKTLKGWGTLLPEIVLNYLL